MSFLLGNPLGAQASLPAGFSGNSLLTEASRQGCLRSREISSFQGIAHYDVNDSSENVG